MALSKYIRNDQQFKIFIRIADSQWEEYIPANHGQAESIVRDYVVAYGNGEIVDNTTTDYNAQPPGTHYIDVIPYETVKMPRCLASDHRVSITHETSKYHNDNHYCTRLLNIGSVPFKVKRFAAFRKASLFGSYMISTISHDWFSHEQFTYWYNCKSEWIQPQCEVADHDNYGSGGKGFWVFEIEFQNQETIFVKSKLPNMRVVRMI